MSTKSLANENRRTVRVQQVVWEDAQRAAALKGTTVSAEINAFLKRLGKPARDERS